MIPGDDGVWSDPSYWSEPAEQAFDKALRKGRRETRFDRLQGRHSTLRSFEEVAPDEERVPEGSATIQTVALDHIVGSVGKDDLFTRSFYPRSSELLPRWKRAYALVQGLRGYEPVELYEAEGRYYVVDGHFRISVARTLGVETIESLVRSWD